MKKYFKSSPFITAPIFGFILLIPFILLELVNRWKFKEGFPFALFTFTWLIQTIFILIIMPIVKNVTSGKSAIENSVEFLIGVIGLVIIAYIWGGLIIDQGPCLVGVPNCD